MTIIEILEDERIPYRLAGESHHSTDGFASVDCPLCSPGSSRWRLGLSLTSGGANCWTCGRQNAGEMLALLTGKTNAECWALLGKTERQEKTTKHRGKLVLPNGLGELLPAHRRYLKNRGFCPDELVAVWGLKGTGAESTLPWRIVIPVNFRNEVVSFTTRQLHDRGKRYLSASPEHEKIPHKTLLLGEEHCNNSICIVEGFFDAARIGPGAVATMGLTVTPSQVRKMTKYARRVIVFDAGEDAQRRARKLAGELSIFPGETMIIELDAADPGSASLSEINSLRRFLR